MNPMRTWMALMLYLGSCTHSYQREYPHAQVKLLPTRLPDIPLTTAEGKAWKLSDWRGKWVITFLGFTNCPDVCPMGLTYLAKETRDLRGRDRLQVMFVSVDPQRDTPQSLAQYVRHFDPSFVGATHDAKTLQDFARSLGAAFLLEKPDAKGNYNVQHSGSLYLIDPEGRLVAAYDSNGKPGALKSDLSRLLQ